MNADELKTRFPRASADFIRANSDQPRRADIRTGSTGTAAVMESNPRDGAMGEVQVQKGAGGRFLIVVESFRRRLLDEDNLCEKYHVDLCRYANALPGDEAGRTKIEVRQEKVGSKEREFVRIKIYRPKEGALLT